MVVVVVVSTKFKTEVDHSVVLKPDFWV